MDAIKKKNQQPAALLHNKNISQIGPTTAGPKPFLPLSFPVLNDSSLYANVRFNINISTIQAENAYAP